MKQHLLFTLLCLVTLMPTKLFAKEIPVAILSSDKKTLTFTYAEESTATATSGDAGTYKLNTGNYSPEWHQAYSPVTTVVFAPSFTNARPTTTFQWFGYMTNLTNIKGIEYLNTSEVTSMGDMFGDCSSLTSLDVSNFNTANVTDMEEMFYNCSSLTSLDLSNFNTENVTNMGFMFERCSSLTSLDVSNFNTQKVTDMEDMFDRCSSLTSLDVSNFNTQKVTNMGSMFLGCKGLTSLDVSNFNTENVTRMGLMFYGCSNLTSLDVSNFNTQKVTSMGFMFKDCSSLVSLDVSNFNTANVTDMEEMFYDCSSLTSLDVSNFNTAKVTDMEKMFYDCSSLTSLDVSNFNTAKVTSMWDMFNGCKSLKKLYIGNNDFENVNIRSDCFNRVGTSSSPCLLFTGDSFNPSDDVFVKQDYGSYKWYGGYFFKLMATEHVSYLYDAANKMFLSRGAAGGTQATIDRYGILVCCDSLSNGAFTIVPADWHSIVYIGDDNGLIYTDNSSQTEWSFTRSGSGYLISNNGKYLKGSTESNAIVTYTTNKSEATVWTQMDVTQHDSIVKAYPSGNYARMAKYADGDGVTGTNFLSSIVTTAKVRTIDSDSYTWAQADRGKSTATGRTSGKFIYTVTKLPEGIYKVAIPAFYRNYTNSFCAELESEIPLNSTAYILANGEQVRIKGWAEECTSDTNPVTDSEAEQSFNSGKYVNEVYCYVGNDSTLTLTVAFPSWQSEGNMGSGYAFGATSISQCFFARTSSLSLSLNSLRMKKGDSLHLSANVNPSNASKIFSWNSSDENVATVNSEGVVTAVNRGDAIISCQTIDGSMLKDSCNVTVYTLTTSISLTYSDIALPLGKTFRQTAITILPSDASQDLAYSSSDESVAKVDSTGLITAVGAGEAVITYAAKDGTGIQATCKVNVFSASLSTTTMSLRKGASYNQQTITITPSSLSESVKLTAVSEDENIAKVDADGTISAMSPGVVNIDYVTEQGDTAATCRVIVYAENVVYVGGLYYLLDTPTAPQATVTSIYGGEAVDETKDSIAQYYSGTINIPETVTYDGSTYHVTHVGSYSFYYQNSLQALIIPKSITEVDEHAAQKSQSLRLVTVAANSELVNICMDAFRDCKSLQRVTFNGTTLKMKKIDADAFQDCGNLQRMIWRGTSSLKTIGDYAFYRCTKLNHFDMPDSVTHVGKHAFRYGESLTDIHLSNSLSIIDEYAFGECGFSNITLPETLASAQAGAFINNAHLTSITIPERTEGLGAACFENNAVLDTITFHTSIHTMTIGNNAFNLCPSITRVNITHMDSWAETNFNNDKANPANTSHHIYMKGKEVTKVVLPKGTLYINSNAFNGCSAITMIDMPSSIGHVNDDIFTGCSSLTDVYCRADIVPLFIGVNDPSAMDDVFNRATLHVPYGYESDYKEDSWWCRFYNIVGFDASVATDISSACLDADDSDATYYSLDGLRIGNKVSQPGVYIRVKNGKSEKVVMKK